MFWVARKYLSRGEVCAATCPATLQQPRLLPYIFSSNDNASKPMPLNVGLQPHWAAYTAAGRCAISMPSSHFECRCCQWDLAEEHVHLTSRMRHDAAPPHTTAAGAADDLEEINEDPTAAVRGIMRKAGLESLEQACPECWDAQRRMVSTHPTSYSVKCNHVTSAHAWQVQRPGLPVATGLPHGAGWQHRTAMRNSPACLLATVLSAKGRCRARV